MNTILATWIGEAVAFAHRHFRVIFFSAIVMGSGLVLLRVVKWATLSHV